MPRTKLSQQVQQDNEAAKLNQERLHPAQLIDIPFLPPVMTIEEACRKFNISRQMVDRLIADGKVYAFVTGMSERGKRKISTFGLIEAANLFPREALVEVLKGALKGTAEKAAGERGRERGERSREKDKKAS